jgi:hypothetical protein
MRSAPAVVASAVLALSPRLAAAPGTAKAPRAAPELPFLPTLPIVEVRASRSFALVVLDLDLPRGDWNAGDVDLFTAFGAPGTPRAVDARLFAVRDPSEPTPEDRGGEPLVVELRPRRPVQAFALLGPSQMAGVVVHLREPAFRRATAGGQIARLEVRALHDLPGLDPTGTRQLVVRLGCEGGAPLALDRIVVRSLEPTGWLRGASAELCGALADPYPMHVTVEPAPSGGASDLQPARSTAAPVSVARRPSDNLCIRLETSS